MSGKVLILLSVAVACQAWSVPFHPVQRAPMRMRYTRYAHPPPQLPQKPHRIPIPVHEPEEYQRPKRGHDDFFDHEHDQQTRGVTGPVHTFVKTDKNANYKWGFDTTWGTNTRRNMGEFCFGIYLVFMVNLIVVLVVD